VRAAAQRRMGGEEPQKRRMRELRRWRQQLPATWRRRRARPCTGLGVRTREKPNLGRPQRGVAAVGGRHFKQEKKTFMKILSLLYICITNFFSTLYCLLAEMLVRCYGSESASRPLSGFW
jgi:hypothetical protein